VSSDSSGSGQNTSKKRRNQKDKECRQEKARDRLARETIPERHLSVSASLFSSSKKIGVQSILRGPKPTSIDVVSPGGQTVGVSVEGVPPSTAPDVACPPAKGVTDPATSVSDANRPPLTKPDSAAPAERNLEVLRGLSELDLIKVLG
jgi:hypothetical protein